MSKKQISMVFIFFIVGIMIGYFVNPLFRNDDDLNINEDTFIRLNGYEFTNPLLECEVRQNINNKEIFSFKENVEDYISHKNSNVKSVSLYFRDLNNGVWFGINEKEDFSPASLLKVPIMMAYLKKAEGDKSFLSKKLKYSVPFEGELKQNIKPKKSIEVDKEYSIEDLLSYMIVYSDNNAKSLLLSSINELDLNQIYIDLGISIPGTKGVEDFMSVKNYASFFRILYNASYLNREMSEKALKLLSQSDFEDGLAAGIPKDIAIAQKFGERKIGEIDQIHDCGIIYYTPKPYLLCVMTRGNDFDAQSKVIADVSKMVFDNIKNQIEE